MYVIGNGESRKNINLDQIKHIKIGCNAVFRDWHMEHVICCDRKMVLEAIEEINLTQSLVYTRPEYLHMNSMLLPLPHLPYTGTLRQDQEMHWGSGPYAVLLAVQLLQQETEINLLGFDLYGSAGLINNVYKDSIGYGKTSDRAVDPRYWIHQLNKIFELNPHVSFVWHHASNFVQPPQLHLTNLRYQCLTTQSP